MRRDFVDSEAGAVIVTFAMSLVLFMLLVSFAVDASNFFRHKRELQNRVDAAVLAGGSELRARCTDDGPILSAASRFSNYNAPKAAPVGYASDGTSLVPVTSSPCAAGALEMKLTESGVKWFFPVTAVAGILRSPLDISASARVELKQIQGQGGELPIAVEEERKITGAWTWLVTEAGATAVPVPGSVRLLAPAGSGTTTTRWTTTSPITHDLHAANLGVRVAVDYAKVPSCAVAGNACAEIPCSLSTVRCYDAGSSGGLLHIHGYESKPALSDTAAAPPNLTDVQITPNAPCTGNGYFNASGCGFKVRARIDWVSEIDGTSTTPVTVSQLDARAAVSGTLGGVAVTLHPTAATRTGAYWEGDTPVVSGPAPAALRLDWTMRDGRVSAVPDVACGKKSGSNGQTTNAPGGAKTPECTGAWNGEAAAGVYKLAVAAATPLHRVFLKSKDRSGDISFAQVTEGGAIANSAVRCMDPLLTCNHAWTVDVDLPAELQLGSHRVLTTKQPGSNDGHLDCDPNKQDPNAPSANGEPLFSYQIANGCNGPRYQINTGTGCPDPAAYGPTEPWLCVASATGDMTKALQRGLDQRVYGSTSPSPAVCAANRNRWPDYPQTDRRLVSVMIVAAGSLSGSGNSLFPVHTFAYFYLTGWGNGNGANAAACNVADSGNEAAEEGTLVGYFVKYTRPNDGSVFGTQDCDPQELGGCVPVMTK